MRQYSVTVIRALSQCPGPNPAGGPPLELEFSVEAKSINRLVAGEHYSIDYSVLSNWITTSSFQVQAHDNGTLKTINASAENQAGEVIGAVAQTAFAVATLVLPVPGAAAAAAITGNLLESSAQISAFPTPSPPPPPLPIRLTCSPAARALLNALKDAKGKVATATAALTEATEDLARMTRLGAETPTERARLYGLMEAQRSRQAELDSAKNALSRAAAPLTVATTYIWPGDFGTRRQELPDPTADEMAKLASLVEETTVQGTGTACRTNESVARCVERQISTFVRLESTETEPETCASDHLSLWVRCVDDRRGIAARSDAGADGLFIRPPADGRLVVCREASDCQAGQDRTVLVDDAVSIPQLGQLRFLPFRTRIFEKNQLALSLRADGSVEKFEIQNAAAARRAAEAMANVAQQAVTFQTQRRTQRAANIAAARAELAANVASTRADIAFERAEEVAQLQHDITLLTRQRELNLLLNPPAAAVDPNAATTAATTALQAEIALLRARLEYLRAEGELAEERDDDDDDGT